MPSAGRNTPSETLRRLQTELPFWGTKSDNDVEGAQGNVSGPPEKKKPKKRGPKTPHPHGRPKLPAHLERVPDERLVPQSQCMCPNCDVEAARVTFKECEKLELQPARFVVIQQRTEVVACQLCHEYVVTAPRPDEIVDRGVLGDELIVHAVVDHHADGVPWERMERNARAQGVPLSANTLAASCGRAIDLLDPIVSHLAHRALSASYFGLDATSIPVLDIQRPLGLRTGALWLLQGDHCAGSGQAL